MAERKIESDVQLFVHIPLTVEEFCALTEEDDREGHRGELKDMVVSAACEVHGGTQPEIEYLDENHDSAQHPEYPYLMTVFMDIQDVDPVPIKTTELIEQALVKLIGMVR